MKNTNGTNRSGAWRIALLIIVASMAVAACSGNSDVASSDTTAVPDGAPNLFQGGEGDLRGVDAESPTGATVTDDGSVIFVQNANLAFDAKVIRDGRIDIRIDAGQFDVRGAELRGIAADLGGYVASGESHIEEYDDARYAVGWFTLRIPSDRFEDAVDRVENLGERVSSSLSSQDVTEEYVDLEGRLSYWKQQKAFYSKLLNQAETVDDLIAVQVQMQDVLLNIEQIEGRIRYLDGRTSFATLTVGLTEVPDVITPPVEAESDPGPIAEAFDQAGAVLLATVSFLIVASAVVIPLAILALLVWLLVRLFMPRNKQEVPEH